MFDVCFMLQYLNFIAVVEGARPRGRPKKTWTDCGKTVKHMD